MRRLRSCLSVTLCLLYLLAAVPASGAPRPRPDRDLSCSCTSLCRTDRLCLSASPQVSSGKVSAAKPVPVFRQAARRHSSTEIICLLAALLSAGVTIVCIYRMRRMENRHKSFPGEVRPAAESGPPTSVDEAEDGAAPSGADTTDAPDEADAETYAPYESNAADYDRIFMQRLDELIAENIMNHDMDVDFLADKMMISRSLLFNRVKRISGISVTKYVNQFRIERSVEMLAQPQLSLTEIAESTGFSTLRYYSRVFKSVKGEIPSVYRERLLNSRQ